MRNSKTSIAHPTHERLFAVAEALRRGTSIERIIELSSIDKFWLYEIEEIVDREQCHPERTLSS